MREAVTDDVSVLQKWPKDKKKNPAKCTSAKVAESIGVTVFQITARLKGMEGRGLLVRENGLWMMTQQGEEVRDNPPQSLARKTSASRPAPMAVVVFDDSKAPRITPEERRKQGWTNEKVWVDGKARTINVSPKGVKYAECKPHEAADLIFEWPKDGWDYSAMGQHKNGIRMRLYQTSAVAKKVKSKEKEEAKAEERVEAKKEAKTKKPIRRKVNGKK